MNSNTVPRELICPGENHAIPYSVHLGRLANFYPVCRTCPFREETGTLPSATVQQLQIITERIPSSSLLTPYGMRGVYLNDITIDLASRWAMAFADLLWREKPRRMSAEWPTDHNSSQPVIVVGHDERPSSRVIFQGILRGLSRMSCIVINLGQTLPTALRFEIARRKSAGGLFVTGQGSGPAWTGMDFYGKGGIAIPLIGSHAEGDSMDSLSLHELEKHSVGALTSPSRIPSRIQAETAERHYSEFLRPWFHALRPLQICIGSPSRASLELLRQTFSTLPCQLSLLELPVRIPEWQSEEDPDVMGLGRRIRTVQADLGVLMDEDQTRCCFLDEFGQIIPSATLYRLLAQCLSRENPHRPVLVEESSREKLIPWFSHQGISALLVPPGPHRIVDQLREHQALCAGGDSGRIWFADPFPFSDAILTLAAVLQLLSQQDIAISQLLTAA